MQLIELTHETESGRYFEITVRPTHIDVVQGNPSTYDSDMDFYGYTEVEYDWEFVKEVFEDGSEQIIIDLDSELTDDEIDVLNDEVVTKILEENYDED